jgi:membrane protein
LARLDPIRRFVQKLIDDRATTLASLLAWGILNTLLPLALCVMALAGLVVQDAAQLEAVKAAILGLLPAQATPAVEAALDAVTVGSGVAGLIALGFLLWNGTNFFVSIESVLDLAYNVPERGLIIQRVIALGILLVFAALLVLAGLTLSMPAISALIMLVAFTVLYTVLPNRPLRVHEALPGALVACALFGLILQLWPLYVALFGQGFSIYLAFGTLLLFLFWLWLVGLVIVGGAELNAFLAGAIRPSGSVRLGVTPAPPAQQTEEHDDAAYAGADQRDGAADELEAQHP